MTAPRAGSSESDEGTGDPVTVYLDDWRQPAHLGPVDDRWSHLIADTEEELHAFAARLGMRRAWFQDRPGRPHHAHYDLPERARDDARAHGAVEVTWRELGRMLRDRRSTVAPRSDPGRPVPGRSAPARSSPDEPSPVPTAPDRTPR